MELLGNVIAGAAKYFRLQVLQCLVNPLTAGNTHPLLAGQAPSVGPGIFGVAVSPEKADPLAAYKSLGNVLAHEGFRPRAMNVALNISHLALAPTIALPDHIQPSVWNRQARPPPSGRR